MRSLHSYSSSSLSSALSSSFFSEKILPAEKRNGSNIIYVFQYPRKSWFPWICTGIFILMFSLFSFILSFSFLHFINYFLINISLPAAQFFLYLIRSDPSHMSESVSLLDIFHYSHKNLFSLPYFLHTLDRPLFHYAPIRFLHLFCETKM